jgi:hypothetical protein
MTKKRVHEELVRTLGIAAAGFLALLAVLPDWATATVALFGVLYAVLVIVIDDDIRALFVRKAPAKSPASRRAAT